MGILYSKPPCGMQIAGGPNGRQMPEYPNGEMIWPDLHEDMKVQLAVEDDSLARNLTIKKLTDASDRLSIPEEASKEKLFARRLENLSISSQDGEEAGLVITGGERILVENANIQTAGDGRNDFNCIGCGLVADRNSDVVVRKSRMEASGLAKCASSATAGARLRVYDSELIAHGGVLPEDYDPTPGPGGMLTPPPGLEIGGTARAHLSMKHSMTYFYRSRIEADGWAALSTDASDGFVYLEANDCDIEVKGPGYAVYSDGGCNVVLSGCRVKTATHTGILAGECTAIFDQVKAESGKYFLMAHNVMGVTGELAEATIIGGEIVTGAESLYLKSCNTYIEMQGSRIDSKSGVIAHAIVNQDMCATKTEGREVFGNNLVLSDMSVEGDFINDDSDRVMTLTLQASKVRGGLKDVCLQLDKASAFVADKDSTVALYSYSEEELANPQAISEEELVEMIAAGSLDAADGVKVRIEHNESLSGKEFKTQSGGQICFA